MTIISFIVTAISMIAIIHAALFVKDIAPVVNDFSDVNFEFGGLDA